MSRGDLDIVFSLFVVAPIGCGAFVRTLYLSCANLEGLHGVRTLPHEVTKI